MSEVEAVALWVGLIASVVGIVLSLVAILFARDVDRRGQEINAGILTALERIQGHVERQSSDTNNLIKAAWDRLLGSMTTPDARGASETEAEAIAEGVVAELREQLEHAAGNQQQLEAAVEELRRGLEGAMRSQEGRGPVGETVNRLREELMQMSPHSRELLRWMLPRTHLSVSQYKKLRGGPLGHAVGQLRERGFLVPLSSAAGGRVYWIHGDRVDALRAALALLPPDAPEISAEMVDELRRIGYDFDPPS